MSEYRLAEKPAMEVLSSLGYQPLAPEATLAMRVEENRVILKPVLIAALTICHEFPQSRWVADLLSGRDPGPA